MVHCTTIAALLGVAILAPTSALADSWSAAATLQIDVQAGAIVDDGALEEREQQASIGTTLRSWVSKDWPVHLALGLDYRMGATQPGGFLYQFNVLPLGLGFTASDALLVGVSTGIGISQITGRLEVAAQVPLETRLELRVSDRIWLAGMAQARWLLRDSRKDGSQSLSFADEASARLTMRWGRRYDRPPRVHAGDGYFVGVAAGEELGSRSILAVFGYAIDVAARR